MPYDRLITGGMFSGDRPNPIKDKLDQIRKNIAQNERDEIKGTIRNSLEIANLNRQLQDTQLLLEETLIDVANAHKRINDLA
jgi:hypothetical protein